MRPYIYLLGQYLAWNAREFGDRPALIDEDARLTWFELDGIATALGSRILDALGIQPASGGAPTAGFTVPLYKGAPPRVCLLIDKNLAGYSVLSACLKYGFSYIPIDPKQPVERIQQMLELARPDAVVAVEPFDNLTDKIQTPAPIMRLNIAEALTSGGDTKSKRSPLLSPPVSEKDCAYALFTSGTTGIPKGVLINQRSLLQYSQWAAHHAQAQPGDVIFGHTPLNFDVSVYAFGAAFVSGAGLSVISTTKEQNIGFLAERLHGDEVTIWVSAPSLMTQFLVTNYLDKLDLPNLRVVSFAAEVLPNTSLIAWMKKFPNASFNNLYGPTEATVTCLGHRYDAIPNEDDPVPIGLPHDNCRIFLLDENNQPVYQPGQKGEIAIHSPGVAVGYLDDQQKTDARFIDLGPASGWQKVYLTGDIGYRNEAGIHYYVGRKDNQVKIRGYRVEPGEIEFILNQHPDVAASVVLAVESVKLKQKILIAYVESPQESVQESDLRYHCSQKLPNYMVPFRMFVKDSLPISPAGKLDRRLLSESALELNI